MNKLPGTQAVEADLASQPELEVLSESGSSSGNEIEELQLQQALERRETAGGQVVPRTPPANPQEVFISDNKLTFGSNVINIRPAITIQMSPDLPSPPVTANPTPSTTPSSTPPSCLPSTQPSPREAQSVPSTSLIRHSMTPEHDSEIYARLLLPRKLGWPLWLPRPIPSLPAAYCREGVTIGDVGIITADGEWDYLWNIRWEAEDERNRERVPTGFTPVERVEISVDETAWKRGSRITNGSIRELEAQLDPPSVSFSFSCTPSEGAIVVLPLGGSRHTLRSTKDFKDYAGVNAESWYQHANSPRRLGGLGREASSGSLYLVTEVNKTRSWGIGSFSDVSGDGSFRMKFSAMNPQPSDEERESRRSERQGETSHCTYEWTESGLATTNHGPILSRSESGLSPGSLHSENQCIFMRGLHVKVREPRDPLSRSGEVTSLAASNPELPSPGNDMSSGRPNASSFWSYFSPGTWYRTNAMRGTSAEAEGQEAITVEFPTHSEAIHPSELINEYLLSQDPSAKVAITHDEIWIDVLKDGATKLPTPKELIEGLEQRYDRLNKGGVVEFMPRDPTLAAERERSVVNIQVMAQGTPLPSGGISPEAPTMKMSHQEHSATTKDSLHGRATSDDLSSILSDESEYASRYAFTWENEYEYEDSEFEDELYSDDDATINIGLAYGEESTPPFHKWDSPLYSGDTVWSRPLVILNAASHDSLPSTINIPGDNEDPLSSGRLREDHLATLRRPSRDLDDDIHLGRARRDLIENQHIIYGIDHPRNPSGASSPASAPQSDTDWRTVESRSSTSASYKGNEVVPPRFHLEGSNIASLGPSAHAPSARAFDHQWSNMQDGIVSMDSETMADIVAPTMGNSLEQKSSFGNFLPAPLLGTRRPSEATTSTVHSDSFGRSIDSWGSDDRAWSFRKERANSVSVAPSSPALPGPSVVNDKPLIDPKKRGSPLYGMLPGQVECWRHGFLGQYTVARKQTMPSDSLKGPQQRVVITSIALPYTSTEGRRNPPMTIHRHSRVTAFSISRHHGWEIRTSENNLGGSSTVAHPHGSTVLVPTSKKSSDMILLAPRRVHEAYTYTNTTQRLESRGLLNNGEQDPRRQKTTHTSGHAYRPSHPLTQSEPSPPRDSSFRQMSSQNSIASSSHHRHTDKANNLHNMNTDDDDDSDDTVAPRKPYPEAYSATYSTSFEQQTHLDESKESFLSRLRRKAGLNPVQGNTPRQHDKPYNPPWITLAPSATEEEQQRAVDNLNTSFRDNGLLPGSSHKSDTVVGLTDGKSDIFRNIASNVLYMLVPLWPSETDPSSREEFPFDKPIIPNKDRQYLVIFYKTFDALEGEDSQKNEKNVDKKHSNRSKKSPHHSIRTQKGREKAPILLATFHITCCVVEYADLIGSGILVPDVGLAVTGPLREAFAKARPVRGDDADGEWALGACHSRESGIEFYRETFVRMNLATWASGPEPGTLISETEEIPEEAPELTPVGRAVMELAWAGAMALTSFG